MTVHVLCGYNIGLNIQAGFDDADNARRVLSLTPEQKEQIIREFMLRAEGEVRRAVMGVRITRRG